MNIIKGFAANSSLVNNTPGQTAQFGELSVFSQTFSKEIGQYKNDSISTDISLVSFYNKDDNGNALAIPQNIQDHILNVATYLYGRFVAATIPNNLNTLYTNLAAQFAHTATWNANQLIPAIANNAQRLPDYINWVYSDTGTGENYDVTLWFPDGSFRVQYDMYEITVIPPFTPVDGFYDSNANVGLRLAAAKDPVVTATAIANAMAGKPYSLLVSMNFTWQEPSIYDAGAGSRTTTWMFLIYGPNGNNSDAQRQAIRDFLANSGNSSLTTGQWSAMFPTIYDTAEYYLIPLWGNTVQTTPSTIYSPVSKPAGLQAKAIANVDFTANNGWWASYLSVVPTRYQQVSVLAIGAPTNTSNNDYDFALKFPDYLDLALTDPDAGRMSSLTQGFVAFLLTLLQGAEALTSTTPINQIPNGYSRTIRGSKVFLEGTYNQITYLALSKASYT